MEDLRGEVVDWVRRHWNADMPMGEWWEALAASGFAVPDWPVECMGLGLSRRDAAVVREVLASERVPGTPAGVGTMMAGPTIIAHGSEAQKQQFLPDIVTGRSNWCQLFSEPEAGSDLASLRTSARPDGDTWIVNGQKVWSSNAHLADMAMLLARTDPTADKHAGITWFAFRMDQPGVDVRPLKEMTGRSLFNEVFITDATVPDGHVVGGLGQGWPVARTTLASERAGLASGVGAVGGVPGRMAGALDKRAGDVAARIGGARKASGTSIAMRGKAFDALRRLAGERDRLPDPLIRDGLAQLYIYETVTRHLGARAATAAARADRPGGDAAIGKLLTCKSLRSARDLAMRVLSADGMLDGSDAPEGGLWQEMTLFTCATSIYGGTDEIQRNVLAERVLGLPRQ